MSEEAGDLKFEALEKTIVGELRAMRRARAQTTIDYLQAPTVVWLVGRGDVDTVALFFKNLAETDINEIRAALASLGFGNWHLNIEQRMSDFGVRTGDKDARTVRRWAEDGFKKIAHLVIEWSREEGNDRPRVDIELSPAFANKFYLDVLSSKQAETMMFKPEIEFVGEPFEQIDETPITQLKFPYAYKARVLAALPNGEDGRVMLSVNWLGSCDSYYQVHVQPGLGAATTAVLISKKGCDIQLYNESSI